MSTTLNRPSYDRNAAIQGILTVIDTAIIEPEDKCGICRELMKDSAKEATEETQKDPVVQLPCRHTFHQSCVTPWLENNPTCPICREHVLPLSAGWTLTLDLGTWQRSRETYLGRLSERYLEGLGPRGAHDHAASEAYLFLTAVTDEFEVPDSDLQYIADILADTPELLTERVFRSTRFYDDCGHGRQLMDYATLARLIREDLVDIDNDYD